MVVVGVSGETPETQALFRKANNLPFPLLGDFDGSVSKAFGVAILRSGADGKAKVDGKDITFKRGQMPARWTFVIGKDGKILSKNEKASAKDDARQALEILARDGK